MSRFEIHYGVVKTGYVSRFCSGGVATRISDYMSRFQLWAAKPPDISGYMSRKTGGGAAPALIFEGKFETQTNGLYVPPVYMSRFAATTEQNGLYVPGHIARNLLYT